VGDVWPILSGLAVLRIGGSITYDMGGMYWDVWQDQRIQHYGQGIIHSRDM
jgi:hypothetical protein